MSGYPWKSITMGICAAICVGMIVISIVILAKRSNLKQYEEDLAAAAGGNARPADYWI